MRKAEKKYPKEIVDLIPKGYYCYEIIRGCCKYVCPFWFKLKDYPEQEDGYCALLAKSDYDINREVCDIIQETFKNGKRKRTLIHCGPHNPTYLSLLWDKCKACNIKE